MSLGLGATTLSLGSAEALAASKSRSLGSRTLKTGAHGGDVKQLQQLLAKAGMKVDTDGNFGPGTKAAVQKFQRAAQLNASGAADPQTINSLKAATTGVVSQTPTGGAAVGQTGRTQSLGDRIPVSRGMSGHDVKVLQDFLHRDGQKVSIDGEFGASTFSAVEAFEKAEGLPVNGVIDANDIDVLRGAAVSGPAAKSAPAPLALAPGDQAQLGPDGLAIAPANAPPQIKAMIAAGNQIAKTPYVYGGGHGKWDDTGYDCSGSVSYVLHAAGLLDEPLVSGDFPSWGTAGPGQWMTIYGNSGHVYAVIAGLRFDTSGATQDGSRWHKTMRPTKGYGVSHPTGF